MKKLISLCILAATLTACAQDNQYGKAYGFANQETKKNPDAIYEWNLGSVICGAIFCETLVVPIYVIGWNLFEAKGIKTK